MREMIHILKIFCDGTLFKTHPIFADHPLALQLVTYYDEIELCNPLGSHRGVHKLGKVLLCVKALY